MGPHVFVYTNKDVESIVFNNGTMFFLPFGIGKIFKNLKKLKINGELAMKRIRRSNLKNLVNLIELEIKGEDIETLEYDCLSDLPNLEVFELRYSKIQQLNERTFERNMKLKEIL